MFVCLRKPLFHPSYLNDNFSGWSILGWMFLIFQNFECHFHCLLVCRVFAKKSSDSLMRTLCGLLSFFHLLYTFKSLCHWLLIVLISCILEKVLSIEVIRHSLSYMVLCIQLFPQFGKFTFIVSLNKLCSLLPLFSFWYIHYPYESDSS